MNWNWAYTKRKQKDMAQKAISKSKNNNGLKPIYKGFEYYDTSHYQTRMQEKLRRDRFVWKVGIAFMTIISIIGFYAIYLAATL